MSYRPICDVWILARPKVKYYGAYPSGFLGRARDLLGAHHLHDQVLHVCSGEVKDYPWRGLGPLDRFVDIDPSLNPDFCCDLREPLKPDWNTQGVGGFYNYILVDPPYTPEEAANYNCGSECCPTARQALHNCWPVLAPGGKIGILHRKVPRPPKEAHFVALAAVFMGYDNDARWFSVFEKPPVVC